LCEDEEMKIPTRFGSERARKTAQSEADGKKKKKDPAKQGKKKEGVKDTPPFEGPRKTGARCQKGGDRDVFGGKRE